MDVTTNKRLYLYCHYGGEFKIEGNQSAHYVGGRTVGVIVNEYSTFQQLLEVVFRKLSVRFSNHVVKYNLTFDRTQLVDLSNDDDLEALLEFSDKFGHLYIFGGDVETQPDIHGGSNVSNVGQSDRSSNLDKGSSEDDVPGKTLSSTEKVTDMHGGNVSMGPAISQRWKTAICGSGQLFDDVDALRQAVFQFSISNKFNYKFVRNSKNQLNVKCEVDDCEWHLIAHRLGSTNMMMVDTFVNKHTHSSQDVTTKRRHMKSKLLATVISNKLKLQPHTTPNDIKASVEAEYGITMTYNQAERCKNKLLVTKHGSIEDSYKLIPWLCTRLTADDEHNVAKWIATSEHRFDKLFIGYGCSIMGFIQGCRPLLFVDRCHLSGPYKGTLLSAAALDADNRLFPLAYAVVSSNSYEDWLWFFENLKSLTGSVKVVIVSDRDQDIIASVGQVYGHKYHAYSYHHLKDNFIIELNKLLDGQKRTKEQALELLDKVAYARLDKDYTNALDVLRQLKPNLAEWVTACEPDHWVMSKFPHPRWDHLTIDATESFNAWVEKERYYSISYFISAHREKLAEKFHKAKSKMTSWSNGVGPKIEEKLLENVACSEPFIVSPYGLYNARVSTSFGDLDVDVSARSCTCAAWQMSGIPCPHACAVIKHLNDNIYQYVDEWYKVEKQQLIYANSVSVVETLDMSVLERLDNEILLLPPTTKRPRGRPKVKAGKLQSIIKRKLRCTQCGIAGHNRATCKNPNHPN